MALPPRDGRPQTGLRGLLARAERKLGCGHEVTREVGVTCHSRRVRSFRERVVAAWPEGGAPRAGLRGPASARGPGWWRRRRRGDRAPARAGSCRHVGEDPADRCVFHPQLRLLVQTGCAAAPGPSRQGREAPSLVPRPPALVPWAAPPSSSRAARESSQPGPGLAVPAGQAHRCFPNSTPAGLALRATLLNVGAEASRVSFHNGGRTG